MIIFFIFFILCECCHTTFPEKFFLSRHEKRVIDFRSVKQSDMYIFYVCMCMYIDSWILFLSI